VRREARIVIGVAGLAVLDSEYVVSCRHSGGHVLPDVLPALMSNPSTACRTGLVRLRVRLAAIEVRP
jgi:hypothetical protein